MQVEIKTVYTKDAILKAVLYPIEDKKRKGINMAIMTAVAAAYLISLLVLDRLSTFIGVLFIGMLAFDLIYAYLYVIYPRILLNKISKTNGRNYSITYVFTEEHIRIAAINDTIKENAFMQYPEIAKVHKKGNDLYLFDAVKKHICFIDLSGAESKDIAILRELFEGNIDNNKFIWE